MCEAGSFSKLIRLTISRDEVGVVQHGWSTAGSKDGSCSLVSHPSTTTTRWGN